MAGIPKLTYLFKQAFLVYLRIQTGFGKGLNFIIEGKKKKKIKI